MKAKVKMIFRLK